MHTKLFIRFPELKTSYLKYEMRNRIFKRKKLLSWQLLERKKSNFLVGETFSDEGLKGKNSMVK